MEQINAHNGMTIGRAGEYAESQIAFALPADWQSVASADNVYVAYKPAGQNYGKPFDVTIANGFALWTTNGLSLKAGAGKVQLTLLEEGEDTSEWPYVRIAKTKVYDVVVAPSVNDEEPIAIEEDSTWLDKILAIIKIYEEGKVSDLQVQIVSALPAEPRAHTFYVLHTTTNGDNYALYYCDTSAIIEIYDKAARDAAIAAAVSVETKRAEAAEAEKQDALSATQMDAVNSGITASDKTKLDGIEQGATKVVVDSAISAESTNPVQNKVIDGALGGKQDALSESQMAAVNSGLDADDKTKLDGIDEGANKTVVDSALSSTSENPVQNKAVDAAIKAKQDTLNSTQLESVNSGLKAADKTTLDTLSGYVDGNTSLVFTLSDGTTQTINFATKAAS